MKRQNVNRVFSICLAALMAFSSLDMSVYAVELPEEVVEESTTSEASMIFENETECDLIEISSYDVGLQDNSVEAETEHEHNYTYEYFDEMFHTALCQSCGYSLQEEHDETGDTCEKCRYQQQEIIEENPLFLYEETVSGFSFNIRAEKGTFPEGTEVNIKKISSDIAQELIEGGIDATSVIENVISFDISFWFDGKEIEPKNGSVSVSVKLAASLLSDFEESANEIKVFYINDEENVNEMDSNLESDTISFETENSTEYVIALLASESVIASGVCGVGVTWSLDSDGVMTISGTGDMNDYTAISNTPWVSDFGKIKKVVLDVGVTKIGDYAFSNCYNLQTLEIKGDYSSNPGVYLGMVKDYYDYEIGRYAFYSCKKLKSIVMNGRCMLDDYCFAEDTALTTATINSFTYVGGADFQNCTALTDLYYGDTYFDYIYWKSNLSLPETTIFHCNDYTAKVTDTITCSIDEDGNLKLYGTGEIPDYSGTSPGKGTPWYQGKTSVTSIEIGEGITRVGYGAFYGCRPTSLSLPSTLKTIGEHAFHNNYGLKEVTIPYEVTTIEGQAFAYTYTLETVYIPDSDISIASNAFVGCDSVVRKTYEKQFKITYVLDSGVNNPQNPNTYGASVGTQLYDPSKEGYSFAGWYTDASFSKKITMIKPGTKTDIVLYAKWTPCEYILRLDANGGEFSNGTNITNYKVQYDKKYGTFPTVTRDQYRFIGWYTAKKDGEKIDADSIVKIVNDTTLYAHWNDLTEPIASGKCGLDLNWSLNELGELIIFGTGAMTDYSGEAPWREYSQEISSIYIEEGCTSIGYCAFENCRSLKKVNLPKSLEIIGTGAFIDCPNIEQFYVEADNSCYSSEDGILYDKEHTMLVAYPNGNKNLTCTIDKNVRKIVYGAFWGNNNIEEILMYDGVEGIDGAAFYNCTALEKITLSSSITEISVDCFYGCKNLKTVEIPTNVTALKAGCFAECTKLEEVFIPESVLFIAEEGIFDKTDNVTVYCYNDYVEIYAIENNIKYVRLNSYKVAAPTANVPVEGLVKKGCRVSLHTDTLDAKIYYTMDDSVGMGVNPGNGILYEDAIIIDKSVSIYAIATRRNYKDSDVIKLTYNVEDDSLNWGDISKEVRIEQGFSNTEDIPNALWVSGISDQDFTGNAITFPDLHVYWYKTSLTLNKDYTVKYSNNTKAGNAMITIKGKGNYTGTIKKNFTINKLSLGDGITNNANLTALDITLLYNKKVQKGTTTVTYNLNGKDVTLKHGKDFSYSYTSNYDYTSVGEHSVTIIGKGNYSGTAKFKETITTEKVPIAKLKYTKIAAQPATGGAIRPDVEIKDGTYTLIKGTDYTLRYQNNVNSGTATVIVTGTGTKYSGTKAVNFKITAIPIKKANVTGLMTKDYTGSKTSQSEYVLTYTAQKGGTPEILYEGTDYTVSYTNEINAGKNKATIIFTGINKFDGTLKKTYTINPHVITDAEVTPREIGAVLYQKGGTKPTLIVKFGNTVLKEGTDYTVKYSYNTTVNDGGNTRKMPMAIVTGKGNFSGTIYRHFTIVGSSLDNTTMTATDITYANRAGICKPTITLVDSNGAKLEAGKDYDKKRISYAYAKDARVINVVNKQRILVIKKENTPVDLKNDIIPVGTEIMVTVTGIKNYAGSTKSAIFRYVAADISKATIKVATQYYTGRPVELSKSDISIVLNKTTLSKTDYEIVGYTKNTDKGTARVTIRGLGNYGGQKTVDFRIVTKSMLYTIKYDNNNAYMEEVEPYAPAAIGTMKNSNTALGTGLTANVYKRKGYTFVGWNTRPDGTGAVYTNREKFQLKEFPYSIASYGTNITLYAQWTPVENKITYSGTRVDKNGVIAFQN